MWSLILLILISLFCCLVVLRRLRSSPHLEYLSYTILLLLTVKLGMEITDPMVLNRAIELIHVSILILCMILLLVIVRILQPDYARQPLAYSYLPVIIFPFYYYFIDNQILADITALALQGTILIVFGGLIFAYFKRVKKGYLLLLSLLLFLSSFAVYWLVEFENEWITAVVHLTMGVGMMITSFRFPTIINKHKR